MLGTAQERDVTCVYVLRNKANRKLYVGQTCQPIGKRLSNHLYAHTKFGIALRKHGIASFERFEFYVPSNLADHFEQEMIRLLDSVRLGYNLTTGGHVTKLSQEAIEKIRVSHLGERNYAYGQHRSKEHRAKISAGLKALYSKLPHHNKGIHLTDEQRSKISQGLKQSGLNAYAREPKSPETRAKIRASLLGRFRGEDNPNWGRKHSDETKRRISLAKKGKFSREENPNFGRCASTTTRMRISQALKGKFAGKLNPNWGKHRQHSADSKKKISEGNAGKHKGVLNENWGRRISDEERAKRSQQMREIWKQRHSA